MFDRKVFFEEVRKSLFAGSLTQQQVDGMSFKLSVWEEHPLSDDLRHLAYPFATAKLETASTMWPVEEIGKGRTRPYGKPHPKTGKIYYGRGDVQLTHYENYLKATTALGLEGADDLVQHPERMLHPPISAAVMYTGMEAGWFRRDSKGPHTLLRYFDRDTNDAFGAREIINGDKNYIPKWDGKKRKIGELIAEYHEKFLDALEKAWRDVPIIPEEPDVEEPEVPRGAGGGQHGRGHRARGHRSGDHTAMSKEDAAGYVIIAVTVVALLVLLVWALDFL